MYTLFVSAEGLLHEWIWKKGKAGTSLYHIKGMYNLISSLESLITTNYIQAGDESSAAKVVTLIDKYVGMGLERLQLTEKLMSWPMLSI